ncbi:MAG: hypothetical protein HGA45_43590, partial [Chloroflexales bacterium]|nr:hypothetical protein [Chloroflexales bacterium]
EFWEGHLVADPLRVDPALFFSELQAELGGADHVEFAFTDTGQLRRPVRWVVTLSGSPRHDRPALLRREFYADDDDLAAAAVADFTRALAGPGPHWR